MGVIVDMNDEGDGSDFNAENFHACFMATIQAASRWSSLNLISPPPHGEYQDLQILQPLTHLESLKFACGSGVFFEQLVIAISRNPPPNLTTMVLADPAAVLCLTQPAFAHIYHSLTTLKVQLSKMVDRTVDILPHLERLETLEACRLCLPFYSPDSTLPLIHTLRFLSLKSVSVQWMAGRAFPSLERCRVTFPHHADILHAFQPVTMPSCSFFLYHSNDLHPLTQFHLPSLDTLDVKNGQWKIWRGNTQLVNLCPILAATPRCLTILRLDVRCSERLLISLLKLAPVLEELWLGLAHPNALGKNFFQALIVREPDADGVSEMGDPPSQTIVPFCPSLRSLHLHYRRWTRAPDNKSLVVALSDIVVSRQPEINSSFILRLSIDGALEESHWTIGYPVRKVGKLRDGNLVLGIPTPNAIIPMSTLLPERGLVPLPFKTADLLCWFAGDSTSLEFRFIHDQMELMVYDYDRLPPPSSLPCALPLFYGLRVLDIKCDNPSFLAGHTFHTLERCRLLREGWLKHSPSERMLTETGMPVCTRVDIDDPWVLAAFKLPQIRELALDFSDANRSAIWERQLAVNVNLSGLGLLHLKNWPHDGDLAAVLRSVPLVETLIITSSRGVASFTAFLPVLPYAPSGLKEINVGGLMVVLLCPRLQSLQFEVRYYSVPQRAPILKDVVALRAECGSPLNVFTFSEFRRWKFHLIGWDGSFDISRFALPKMATQFALSI